jgi:hypothetical protein
LGIMKCRKCKNEFEVGKGGSSHRHCKRCRRLLPETNKGFTF